MRLTFTDRCRSSAAASSELAVFWEQRVIWTMMDPAELLISYCIMASLLYCVVVGLGYMIAAFSVAGGYVFLVGRFSSPELSFAIAGCTGPATSASKSSALPSRQVPFMEMDYMLAFSLDTPGDPKAGVKGVCGWIKTSI